MQYRALKSPEFLRKTHFQLKILAKIGDWSISKIPSLCSFLGVTIPGPQPCLLPVITVVRKRKKEKGEMEERIRGRRRGKWGRGRAGRGRRGKGEIGGIEKGGRSRPLDAILRAERSSTYTDHSSKSHVTCSIHMGDFQFSSQKGTERQRRPGSHGPRAECHYPIV